MINALYQGVVKPCTADYRSEPNFSKAMEEIVSAFHDGFCLAMKFILDVLRSQD